MSHKLSSISNYFYWYIIFDCFSHIWNGLGYLVFCVQFKILKFWSEIQTPLHSVFGVFQISDVRFSVIHFIKWIFWGLYSFFLLPYFLRLSLSFLNSFSVFFISASFFLRASRLCFTVISFVFIFVWALKRWSVSSLNNIKCILWTKLAVVFYSHVFKQWVS